MDSTTQKMAVCRDFQTDSCKRETCKFAHIISSDPESFQSKPSSTRACLDYQKGACMREVCKFAHVIIERSEPKNTASNACRAFQTNSCARGESCRFAHIVVEDPSSLEVRRPRRRNYRRRGAAGAPQDGAPEQQSAPRQRGICRDFQKGNCERGDECTYRHEEKAPASQPSAPRQPKPVGACRDFQTNSCTRESCKFAHVIDANASQPRKRDRSNKACREFQTGSCTRGDGCRYSHTTAEFAPSA